MYVLRNWVIITNNHGKNDDNFDDKPLEFGVHSIQTDPYLLLDTAMHHPSPRGSYWTSLDLLAKQPSIGLFCVYDLITKLPCCQACSASQRLVEAANILDTHCNHCITFQIFPVTFFSQPLFNCPQLTAANHDSMRCNRKRIARNAVRVLQLIPFNGFVFAC